MNNCARLFSIFFFLSSCCAFAGKTTLTSYYPAPTAAYTKINLATNTSFPFTSNPNYAATYCASSNIGATYQYTTTNTYYTCTGAGTSVLANGIVHVDSNGTLYVIQNGQNSVYPQQCYNAFCSFDNSVAVSCTASCANGFTSSLGVSDTFQTSAHTTVISVVCCTS